ncbi:MAG: PilZ domain-containing protein [Candidatus Omnitrophota bacterium]
MSEERRKDPRIKEDFSILCQVYRKVSAEGNPSKVLDISHVGICFLADREIAKDDVIRITLRVPPDFKEKAELFGRVIESIRAEDGNFKTRAAFFDLSAGAKNSIDHLSRQSKTP